MAHVHRLQHVQHLVAAHLAHHNAIGAHAQRRAQQIAQAHPAAPFHIGWACLQGDDMGVLQAQLRGLFHGHDAFTVRDVARQHVQQRSLARGRAASDGDIAAPLHRQLEQLEHGRAHEAQRQQLVRVQRLQPKAPDRHHRALGAQRRNHRMQPAAIIQTRIHMWRTRVQVLALRRHQAVEQAAQVALVVKHHRRALQSAAAVHPHLAWAIDENVGDFRVGHQGRQRPQAPHLVDDLAPDTGPVGLVQRAAVAVLHLLDQPIHLLDQARLGIRRARRLALDVVEQLAMHEATQATEATGLGFVARGGRIGCAHGITQEHAQGLLCLKFAWSAWRTGVDPALR